MAMLRSDFTRLIVNEGIELFWKEYQEVSPVWTNFFRERPTTTPLYRSSTMIGVGDLMPKKEAEPFSFDQPSMGWEYAGRVHTFGKGIEFSMELYEDTQFRGWFLELVAKIAQAYPRTRDRFFAQYFNHGALLTGHPVFNASIPGLYTDPTGNMVYDGKPFFADAANPHPLKMAGMPIVNYFPLELTHENLTTVWRHMVTRNNRDENGNKIVLRPDTLLIPPSLLLKAMEILDSKFMPSMTGTPSIPNPLYRRFAVVEWPELEHEEGWFLLERGRGMHALNRKDLEIDAWVDPETKTYKALVNCRFGGYVDDIRYGCACNTQQS